MKISKNKRLRLVVAGMAVLLFVGLTVFYSSKPKAVAVVVVTPQSTPTPSPGSPGNPGDAAKSSTPTPNPTNKATPTPTPTPQGGVAVSIDTVTPQPDAAGTLRIANTVTGITTGSCLLELTNPNHQLFSSTNGTIGFDGTAHFCSFPTITGVTASGSWSAKLTVTSGSSSGFDTQGFTK